MTNRGKSIQKVLKTGTDITKVTVNNLLLMQFRSLRTSVSRLLFRGSSGHDLTWITAPLDPRKLVSYRWVRKKNKSILNEILKNDHTQRNSRMEKKIYEDL